MTTQEATQRLCALITEVGERFDHLYAHDCICGSNPGGSRVDEPIIEFIEKAVRERNINFDKFLTRTFCIFCGRNNEEEQNTIFVSTPRNLGICEDCVKTCADVIERKKEADNEQREQRP